MFLTDPDLRARFWPNEPPHLNLVIVNLLKNTSNLIVKLKGLNFFLGLSPVNPQRASSRDKRGKSVSERSCRAILVVIQDRSGFAVKLMIRLKITINWPWLDNVYQQRKEVSHRYCEFAVFNQSFKNITDQSFFAASRSFTYRLLKYIIFGLVYFLRCSKIRLWCAVLSCSIMYHVWAFINDLSYSVSFGLVWCESESRPFNLPYI